MRYPGCAIAALILATTAGNAAAQTYTVDSLTSWSLGTVAAATSGTTVFLNSANGNVAVISGGGNFISGPYAYETVSIRCVDQGINLCSNSSNMARIRVGRTGVNTGRAQTITVMGAYNGTGTVGSGTNETTSTLDFPLSGWTATNQVLTFKLSLYWPINGDDGAGATGAASSQFYVYAAKNPTVPTTGLTGTITTTVRRALTITKVSDLRFGTFTRPTSGTNRLGVDINNNRVQDDGNGNFGQGTIGLVPSSYGPAQFTVKGEPSTTLSISFPSTFTMTGPGTPLTVTLSPSAMGNLTIPASGTFSLLSGGYFNVSSGQASGNYSGTFTVTIAYY